MNYSHATEFPFSIFHILLKHWENCTSKKLIFSKEFKEQQNFVNVNIEVTNALSKIYYKYIKTQVFQNK